MTTTIKKAHKNATTYYTADQLETFNFNIACREKLIGSSIDVTLFSMSDATAFGDTIGPRLRYLEHQMKLLVTVLVP